MKVKSCFDWNHVLIEIVVSISTNFLLVYCCLALLTSSGRFLFFIFLYLLFSYLAPLSRGLWLTKIMTGLTVWTLYYKASVTIFMLEALAQLLGLRVCIFPLVSTCCWAGVLQREGMYQCTITPWNKMSWMLIIRCIKFFSFLSKSLFFRH